MLSKRIPQQIGAVPTAQTVYDALSVSDHMDHVVDNWIAAYTHLQIAKALSDYANRDLDVFSSFDTDEYKAAKTAFDKAYMEMLYRFNEYKS